MNTAVVKLHRLTQKEIEKALLGNMNTGKILTIIE